MKTKHITLIFTLLFCLSGSVYGEVNVNDSSKIRFKKSKNREHRFREIIDIDYLRDNKLNHIVAKDLDDLLSKTASFKKIKIDMGKIWAVKDMKYAKLNVRPKDNYLNLKKYTFKPLKKYKNLMYCEKYIYRSSIGSHQRLPGDKVHREYVYILHSDHKKLKLGKYYNGYFPMGFMLAQYTQNINGIEVVKNLSILDYGKPITEDEYNKQLNADKDEN